jgi:hypothetical protein
MQRAIWCVSVAGVVVGKGNDFWMVVHMYDNLLVGQDLTECFSLLDFV